MRTRTQRAYEARRNIVAALDAHNDGIETRGEGPSAEDVAATERMEAELRSATEALEAAIEADSQEKRFDEAFANAGFTPADKTEERSDDQWAKDMASLAAFTNGEARHVDFLPESFGPLETRAALDKDAARGGDTVPTTMYSEIIKALREFSTVVSAGAKVINTASGEEITVPYRNTYPTAALVAEGGTYGKSDGTYDALAIGAYKYGFISQVSQELLADSAFDMAAEVGAVGGEAIGLGTGVHFLSGTGSSQPEGVLQATSGTDFAAVAAITGDELIDITHSITRPYRPGSVFIMADSTIAALRKLKDNDDNYLWRPGLTADAPDTILGYPVFADPNMPTLATGNKTVVFGNLSRGLLIRMAGGVRVERSSEYAWDTDLESWKFTTRMDSKIVDGNAIRVFAQA